VDNLTSGAIIVKKKYGIFRLLSRFDTCGSMGYTRQMRTLFLALLLFILPVLAWSHPGKTDSVGGHKCYKGCEKWELLFGEYHLHDKDGKPIRVAKKVRKKQRVAAKPLMEPAQVEKVETPQPLQAAARTLPTRAFQPEKGLSTSPLMLLLLALLLLLLLIKRRTRDRR
jgi:hypothetical protein